LVQFLEGEGKKIHRKLIYHYGKKKKEINEALQMREKKSM